MKKRIFLILTAVAVILTGCAKKSSSSENSGTAKDNGYNLIFVCPIIDNEYWTECINGINKADSETGTKTKIIGPENADGFAEKISGYMEEAINEKPDGIIAYAGIESMNPLIEKASEQGIPVLALDSDAEDTSRIAFVGTDAYNSGYAAGETMVDLTGGKAKIGILVSSMAAEKEMSNIHAFTDAISDYDMEIVAVDETDADPDVAEEKTRKMLKEHPEINALFNTAGYNVTGAGRVKKELGLDDLTLVGFDDVEENIELVREGIIDAIFVQRIEQAGYQSVYLMNEYLKKGRLSNDNYDSGTILVTKENVDTYNKPINEPASSFKTVKVGYYSGDRHFQDGYEDSARKSGYAYDYYQALAPFTGWKYEYVYGTRQEIIDMLSNGQVDIAAGIYKTENRQNHILFSDQDIGMNGQKRYFAVNMQNTELLEELDDAMQKLLQATPDFHVTLKQKYYSKSNQSLLTDSEREWLNEKGELRIGYVRYNLPFSERNKDGQPTGMIKELTDLLRDFVRIDIVPVCYENIIEMENALSNNEIDAAFPIYSDQWLNETKNFRQTDYFISDRVMIVYQGNYTGDIMDKVALSETGIGQRYYMETFYPNSEITFYDSRNDAFKAIINGDERCIVGCSSIFQRFISEHPEYQDLNIAYLDETENFGMAVNEKNFVLAEILNKAIWQFDDANITSTIMKYSAVEKPFNLKDFARQYSFEIIAVMIVFFAVLLFIFITYRRKTKAFNSHQAKAKAEIEKAFEAAQVASEAKTTFLSSMSHDIRTPMNAIVGMTSIAERHIDDKDRVKKCLEKISMSSHYLMTLINDILDISKIESGKLALNPVVFSIRNTVFELINIVHTQIKEKNLEFETNIRGMNYEMLYADEVRVNQIFINILTNAIKYTPENGKVIMSLTEEILPDEKTARLTYVVQDNGIGMSEEFMATMYETFSRAKDARTDKIQGTGLGLAIVKQIVDIMGGTIECESREQMGTKFTVTLDIPIRKKETENLILSDLRVLIVDDDEVFREDASEILLDMDALPETASSGREAVEMVRLAHKSGNDYPVAIIDWKMPGMDGIETIREIREIVGDRISIILVSAFDWIEIEDEQIVRGADDFISKLLFKSYIHEKLCKFTSNGSSDSYEDNCNDEINGRHILVAEDNELNWEVLNELLSVYGITAEWAENGQICYDMLSKAEPETYDMILMDIQMPVMNGKETTRKIRKDEREYINNIPIIAITADAFAEDIAACFDAGMDGHVSKPIEMENLCQEMRKVFHKRKKRK